MAERRMFAKSIVLSDSFLDMPASARCLYFTLNMFADDDGFVGSPKGIMRQCGASEDDMRILLGKRFILGFETGVIVIKHWRIHNYIQSDRYKPTNYVDEKAQLSVQANKAYSEMYPECIQNVSTMDTQVRLGKSKSKDSIGKSNKTFTPPTLDEVRAYCLERKNSIDPEAFVDFYASKGWKVGNQPMKDWKACVRTWERRRTEEPKKAKQTDFNQFAQRDNDWASIEKKLIGLG